MEITIISIGIYLFTGFWMSVYAEVKQLELGNPVAIWCFWPMWLLLMLHALCCRKLRDYLTKAKA